MDGTESLDLAREFAALSDELHAEPGAGTLPRLLALATRTLNHCNWASIVETRLERAPRTLAASDAVAAQFDAGQFSVGEGPALTATTSADVLVVDDLRSERRWPRFCAAAATTPLR